MVGWNKSYVDSKHGEFDQMVSELPDKLEAITDGRVVPEVNALQIGSARKLRGAVLFFDIREFTNRTGSPDDASLKNTLYMINSVIPTVMKIIHDLGGYIEKNTGDGVMAVIGAEANIDDKKAAEAALEIALQIFYFIKHKVNPHLVKKGIAPVNARIGIDLGPILVARVGVPKGTASQERSFLTAIGPAANLACKFQGMAGTNEIWVGDLIKVNAPDHMQQFFHNKTPILNWFWIYIGRPDLVYSVWHFSAYLLPPIV